MTTENSVYPSVAATLKSVLRLLPANRRAQFWVLALSMLGAAGIETVALGFVAVFASAVTDPAAILQSRYVVTAKSMLPLQWLATPESLIVSLSILVVVLIVLKNVLLAGVLYLSSRFAAFVDGYFGEVLMGNFLIRPYEWHLSQNSADLVLAVDWRRYFGVHFLYPVLYMASDGFVILLMLGALFWAEPFVSLGAVSILGGIGALILVAVKGTLDRNTEMCRDYQQSVNRQVTKSIHGVKDVKVFGKQPYFLSEFSRGVYTLARREAFRQFFSRSPAWILETIGFVIITATICAMMFWMKSSTVKVTGTIALIAVTAWRVLPAMNRIVSGISSLRTVLPYIYNAFAYLGDDPMQSRRPATENPLENAARMPFERELGLHHISFAYDGSDGIALDDIDLRIRKGQTVGIIGPSGAGKSTLVDILIGLLIPTSGDVSVDGVPLDKHTSAGWMRCIGYVSQSPYIYDGTMAENIAFGVSVEAIDRDLVTECCRLAAMDFLGDLPHGIDTPIGERGLRLSGGQRQRVAIARALYHKPQVMIFDEATSALDAKNEEEIQNTVYALRGQLTLIIIAHRLTTVEDCDRLFCIDRGKLVKVGPPGDVLPWYAEYMSQRDVNQ